MNERIEEDLKGMDLKNQILQKKKKKLLVDQRRFASGLEEIPSDQFV